MCASGKTPRLRMEMRVKSAGAVFAAGQNLAASPFLDIARELRVVLLEHASGNWAAYMSSDPSMSVEAILEAVSDRWAIEEQFHDVKEIWGAGEQQVRNLWSNIGCWNLCGWLYTLVELASWDQPAEQLVDRADRPWDNPARRPSHADRRRKIACRATITSPDERQLEFPANGGRAGGGSDN